MEVFLTLAERHYMVKYELDGLRAQRDLRVPGLMDSCTLQNRDNICECLQMCVEQLCRSFVHALKCCVAVVFV